MLTTLIYGSTATQNMSDDDLLEILNQSKKNNTKNNVTGVLLYKGGNFLQVLEGEEAVVDELYEKIQFDPRHRAVSVILKRPAKSREFSDWKMGFVNLDAPPPVNHPGFTDFLQQPITVNSFNNNPSRVDIFLKNFKDLMR